MEKGTDENADPIFSEKKHLKEGVGKGTDELEFKNKRFTQFAGRF